jgi:hypothetical protein
VTELAPATLEGKTVLFVYRDGNGEPHHRSYGRVVRPGRKAIGSGITAAGRIVKRRTVEAVLVRKGFSSIGLSSSFNRDILVPLDDLVAVRVRGRDIPITEFQGGVQDGRAEDAEHVREPRGDHALGIEP